MNSACILVNIQLSMSHRMFIPIAAILFLFLYKKKQFVSQCPTNIQQQHSVRLRISLSVRLRIFFVAPSFHRIHHVYAFPPSSRFRFPSLTFSSLHILRRIFVLPPLLLIASQSCCLSVTFFTSSARCGSTLGPRSSSATPSRSAR